MKVLLDHVAVGVRHLEDAVPIVVGALGGRAGRGGPSGSFDWHTWVFRGGANLEIITPTGDDGFLHRFLDDRGPGIHHVTFYVPDLHAACDRAAANGYRVVGFDDSRAGWQEAFLHPKTSLGIVVQLATTSDEHESEGYGWKVEPGTASAPDAVTLVGVRMSVPDVDAARRLFETTLCGTAGEEDGALCFRWPDSPLRIALEIDPLSEPGPVALEVDTERDVDLLDAGPAPEFGAALIRVAAAV